MEGVSLNYGHEHFRRLDMWTNDELGTLRERVSGEIDEGVTVLSAIGGIMRERGGQQRMFVQEAPGYDDRQGEVELALRRGASENEA